MEGTVKQTVTPLNTDHRRRVATVKGVFVVEGLSPSQRLLDVDGPSGQRFAPCHADVVVQFTMAQE
jgi:hypothetical protein